MIALRTAATSRRVGIAGGTPRMALAHSRRTASRSRKRAVAMVAVSMPAEAPWDSPASRMSVDASVCAAAHAGRRSRTL